MFVSCKLRFGARSSRFACFILLTMVGVAKATPPTKRFCSIHRLDQPEDTWIPCQPCSCHDDCLVSNNCCPDILQDFLDAASYRNTNSCIPLHLRKVRQDSGGVAFVNAIDKCPTLSTDDEKKKCERNYHHSNATMRDIMPAWHESGGVVYRNHHCSSCHGVPSFNVILSGAKLECHRDIPSTISRGPGFIQYVLESLDCSITFRSHFVEAQNCTWGISSCNVTGLWTEYDANYDTACMSYTSLITMADGLVFKNIFCAFCNGYEDLKDIGRVPAKPFSFSGLLTHSSSNKDGGSNSVQRKCSSGYIYQANRDRCVEAKCSFLRELVGDECVLISNSTSQLSYEAIFSVTTSVPQSMSVAINKSDAVVSELKLFLKTLAEDPYDVTLCSADILVVLPRNISSISDTYDILLQNVEHFLMRLNFRIGDDHLPESVLSKLAETMQVDSSNMNGLDEGMITLKLVDHYLSEFEEMAFGAFSQIGDKVLVPLCPPESVVDVCSSLATAESHSATSLLPCPTIQVSYDTYPWVVNDNGAYFSQSQHKFSRTQFFLSKDSLGITTTLYLCKDQYFELTAATKTFTSKMNISAEQIASIASMSFSISSLLLTLSAFALLTPMRNLPGRNNMALVTSLLIAQVLYLVSSFSRLEQGSVSCKIVGMLTHFFWLLVIFWMNVCTFHMFHVLTKTKVMSRGAGVKRYIAYHVYAIACSVVFVGINILVSSITSGFNDIGYGLSICYVSSQKMLMYTFALPLAIVVISNLGMFLWVIISIKRMPAILKNVKNERNDLAIFARLSTLTGVTWIFGFLYSWTGQLVLSFIFIIFNAGQGVFLFLSFVCNRHVVLMARRMFSRNRIET